MAGKHSGKGTHAAAATSLWSGILSPVLARFCCRPGNSRVTGSRAGRRGLFDPPATDHSCRCRARGPPVRPQLTVLGPAEVESEVSGSEGRVPRTVGHPTGPVAGLDRVAGRTRQHYI